MFYSNLEKYKIKGLIFSGYLLDETDPSLTQGVFFEVRLELSEPDVIFVPPLDKNLVGNFYDQINGYLDDIFFGCSLIPRVAKHLDKGYETDKAKDNKISLIFLSSPIACVACERTELLKTEIVLDKMG